MVIALKECPNREDNLSDCTCSHPGCSRKGLCCLCIRHHREAGQVPGCLFPEEAEKTLDRSVQRFVSSVNK